jgi:phosphate/sulfate permease
MALVLAETAVGGLFVLWVTPTWGVLRTGFFKLTGTVLAACGVLAWLAASDPLRNERGSDDHALAFYLLLALAAAVLLWQVLTWFRAPAAGRIVGILAVPLGVAALISLAVLPEAARSAWVGVVQLIAGAVFLGSVVDGLLLGHWYLVDKRASREPLKRMAQLLLAGSVAAIVATLIGGGGGGSTNPNFSPLLGAGALTVALAVGLAALCVMIGFFIRAMVREDSIQAATGFFYLAVIMALAAEFAAKVRFY